MKSPLVLCVFLGVVLSIRAAPLEAVTVATPSTTSLMLTATSTVPTTPFPTTTPTTATTTPDTDVTGLYNDTTTTPTIPTTPYPTTIPTTVPMTPNTDFPLCNYTTATPNIPTTPYPMTTTTTVPTTPNTDVTFYIDTTATPNVPITPYPTTILTTAPTTPNTDFPLCNYTTATPNIPTTPYPMTTTTTVPTTPNTDVTYYIDTTATPNVPITPYPTTAPNTAPTTPNTDFPLCNYTTATPNIPTTPYPTTTPTTGCQTQTPFTATTPPAPQMMCPDGWEFFQGRCYLFVDEPLHWPQALSHCAMLESALVSVHSPREYGFLQQLTGRNGNQYGWLGGFYLQDQAIWIDGSWIYNNWGSESSHSSAPCLLLSSSEEWSNSPCFTGNAFICVKFSNVQKLCPEGWTGFHGRCYRHNQEYLTWPEADTLCASQQASLVSVSTPEEYSFLYEQTHALGSSEAWLGGFYLDDQWLWLDGSWFYQGLLDHTSADSVYRCLSTGNLDGWISQDCDRRLFSFCVKDPVV